MMMLMIFFKVKESKPIANPHWRTRTTPAPRRALRFWSAGDSSSYVYLADTGFTDDFNRLFWFSTILIVFYTLESTSVSTPRCQVCSPPQNTYDRQRAKNVTMEPVNRKKTARLMRMWLEVHPHRGLLTQALYNSYILDRMRESAKAVTLSHTHKHK